MPPDPRRVLSQYLPATQIGRVESLASAGGWSGSLLWRVWPTEQSGQSLCLRRWSAEHPTPERLQLIHGFLTHLEAQGIDFIPVPRRTIAGATFVRQAGHLWELAPWLPGIADYRDRPTRPRLAAALTALARVHQASGSWQSALAAAPALIERRELVLRLLAGDSQRIAAAVGAGLSLSLDDLARRIHALAAPRLPPLLTRLAAASTLQLPLQPAIRDVHREHVLFTGDEVTGLIDFGALRIDTPLADVARLVGSLAGDDAAARDFALAAYHAIRPLSDRDRALVQMLDQSSVVLAGLSWLEWQYLDRRDMGPLPPIAQRLKEILARLNRQE